MDIITNFSTFVLAFSFIISVLVISRLKKTSYSTGKHLLPPGPWKLPILGNLHNLAGSLPHRAMRDLAQKFGPLMHLQLGEVSHIVVSSPEMAKEIMKNHDIVFASRPNIILSEILLYNNTGITFAPYGDYWRQLKKMCASELLSAKRVKSFRVIREQETLDMIKLIAAKAKEEGESINLTEIVFSLVFSITSRASFGKKTEEQDKLIDVIKQASVLAAGVDISDLYPSLKFLRSISKVNKTLKRIFLESDRLLEKIVNDHKTTTTTTAKKVDDDLVDVLLRYQLQNPDFCLTKQNIKAVLMDISIGGTDGSANTINWAMAEMMKNPRILERAQEEVRKAFGKEEGYIDEEKFDELPYIKSVIKETLRLHPPAPLLVPRENIEKAQINGYTIPAKSKILINVWAINRDPRYWEEAESFKPERFLGSLIDYKGTDFQYLTFGSGRRMCPGIAYGLANVLLPLVQLLYYFDWKLPTGIKHQELNMTEEHGLAVRRKDDLYLIPSIHNSLPLQPL